MSGLLLKLFEDGHGPYTRLRISVIHRSDTLVPLLISGVRLRR